MKKKIKESNEKIEKRKVAIVNNSNIFQKL